MADRKYTTSTLIASIVLVSLERQRRMRRDCIARRSCLEMTPRKSDRFGLRPAWQRRL